MKVKSLLSNKKIIIPFIVIISVIFVILARKSLYKCSGDKCYKVDRYTSDKSFEMLQDIEKDIKELLSKIYKDPDCPLYIKERIPYSINNSTLSENIYGVIGDTSFTVDKRDVYLCLKGDDGVFYEKNLIIMVAIHEYSHILCKSQDHSPEFYSIYKFILEKAVVHGYYVHIDFNSKPINYCGLMLRHNSI